MVGSAAKPTCRTVEWVFSSIHEIFPELAGNVGQYIPIWCLKMVLFVITR